MRITELAVDMTMDRAGMPSGELGSLSAGEKEKKKVGEVKMRPVGFLICTFYCDGQPDGTFCKPAADLHGAVPLAVLAGEESVVALQGVALVAEVLDDSFLGELVAGRRVTAVAPILRLSRGGTDWKEREKLKRDQLEWRCRNAIMAQNMSVCDGTLNDCGKT